MKQQKIIPYGRQHITEEDIQAVVETLRSDFLTQGPKIAKFEEKFAQYVGVRHAVAVANGTAALHLAAMALNVKPKDRVIVPPTTFIASANCVKYCGAEVVFCDINAEDYLLDLNKLEQMLKDKPKGYYKGIIPVDFAGYPVHGETLQKLAAAYGLWIIEDACHAPGAYFLDAHGEKQMTGNGKFADLTCFSFHPVKHIATAEGGMITTNSKDLYEHLLSLRTHGIIKTPDKLKECHGGWYYEMQTLGYNYRLTDIQAALGISQLQRAAQRLEQRQMIAKRYDEAFNNLEGVVAPKVRKDVFHAYHLYVIQVKNRLQLYDYLRSNSIFSQVHYIPVHLHPYYQQLGSKKGDMPVAEEFYEHCLSLPIYPTLLEEEQKYVIEKVKECIVNES